MAGRTSRFHAHARLLAALLLLVAGSSSGVRAQNTIAQYALEGASHILIDGRYYTLEPGTLTLKSDGGIYAGQAASMRDCVRPAGASQQVTTFAFRWNSGLRVIYLDTRLNVPGSRELKLRHENGHRVVELRSATGDISCQGAVQRPGVLFESGFE